VNKKNMNQCILGIIVQDPNPDTALDPNFEEKALKLSCANFFYNISHSSVYNTPYFKVIERTEMTNS
jgi:hypothetical protein